MYGRRVNTSVLKPGGNTLPAILMIGGSIVGLGTYIKNTVLVKQYGKKIQLHGNDGPIEPSVKLEDLVSEVSDNLSKSVSENTPILPILIPGTRKIHAGTIGTFQGGVIGLPSFFEFNNIEEIDGKIQWHETSALNIEEVYNAFLLSNEAKKYGIARELLLVNTPQVYIDTALPVAIPFLADKLVTYATTKTEMLKIPSSSRNLFSLLFCVLVIAIWRYLHIKLKWLYENEAEKTISQLGEDYIRGAVEYNTKTIQRNLCSAEIKDQKNRFFKKLSDIVELLFSARELPSQKVHFYKSLTLGDDKMENDM